MNHPIYTQAMHTALRNHGKRVIQAGQTAFLSAQGYTCNVVCNSRKDAALFLAELHRATTKPVLERITLTWIVGGEFASANAKALMIDCIKGFEEVLANHE